MRKGSERHKLFERLKNSVPTLLISETPDLKSKNHIYSRNSNCSMAYVSRSTSAFGSSSKQVSPAPRSKNIYSPNEDYLDSRKNRTDEKKTISPIKTSVYCGIDTKEVVYQDKIKYLEDYIYYLKKRLGATGANENFESDYKKYLQSNETSKKLQDEISYLNEIQLQKDNEIETLLADITDQQNQIEYLSNRIRHLERVQANGKGKRAGEISVSIENEIKRFYENQIEEIERICMKLEMENEEQAKEIDYLSNEINNYKRSSKNEHYEVLTEELTSLRKLVNSLETQIKNSNEKHSLNEEISTEYLRTIVFFKDKACNQEIEISKLEDKVNNLLQETKDYNHKMVKYYSKIKYLKEKVNNQAETILSLKIDLKVTGSYLNENITRCEEFDKLTTAQSNELEECFYQLSCANTNAQDLKKSFELSLADTHRIESKCMIHEQTIEKLQDEIEILNNLLLENEEIIFKFEESAKQRT